MTTPQISPLPPMPARTDAPVDFSAKADAALAALQPFADQANALALDANAKAAAAASSAASVAGVQTAVNNDRVLSQQAAQNAAGSAAAAGVSATSAQNSATAAGLSAAASEASAVRAEDAAQYVESITDGAAPLNSPNFTGTVMVNDVPLGTAAFKNVGTATGEVMEMGAFGIGTSPNQSVGFDFHSQLEYTGVSSLTLGGNAQNTPYISWGGLFSYKNAINSQAGLIYLSNTANPNATTPRMHIKTRPANGTPTNWVEMISSANLLQITGQSTELPMSQKAVTDALDNIDVSGPRPTKDHGDVATAGSQTVVCNVQESDFHMMSMATANTTGTLTIDFANMPDTLGKHFAWHVRLRRGGRKPVAFAQTIAWSGGVAPAFGTATGAHDLIMFYKVGGETIRGMVVDAW